MSRFISKLPGGFTWRVGPTLITFVMIVVLLALGTWQVKRLHWKEHILTTIHERLNSPPIDLDVALKDPNADYQPTYVSGLFQHDQEFYLNAISLKGEGGYSVLTPLQLEDGRLLLVNRGWVPYDKRDPHTRPDRQSWGPVTIKGLLRHPQHIWLQTANIPKKNIWYSIDLDAMARQAGVPRFLPYVLDADATPNDGGYPIGGQTRVDLPNNHLVYALIWYGLAFSLGVLYILDACRKR